MTLVASSAPRAAASTSMPVRPGIFMSVMTTSGGVARMAAMASAGSLNADTR